MGLGDRVCEDCLGLRKGTYRRRIRQWANRQSLRFAAMVDEQEGGESAQVESLASSQSQSQRGRSMGSSGTSSRSRAPSRTQLRAQTEVEVELSEGDDDFLSIYVAEPEGMVSEKQKRPISPTIYVPSPVPSLQSAQIL